jgi:hypothetical protein
MSEEKVSTRGRKEIIVVSGISTENDHRHHHKFIKYEKRLRKEGNVLGLPIKQSICHFSVSVDA